ncbi:MAG: anti-sigma factor [Actinomycetota bacterium]|nr:anti-sigma factor [Actinomycetota bacterium]
MARAHESHADDPAAYLLGALSELERQAFERHLMGCSPCREELDHLRPAADALPRSVAPVRPPDALKRSVMGMVEREAAGREQPSAPRSAAAGTRRRLRSLVLTPINRRPALAWVTAVFLLAVGLAFGAVGASLLSGDDGRTLTAQVDSVRVPEASGSLVVSGDQSRGAILRVHGMPSLPSREVYQVWVQRGGEMVSQSIFSVGQDGGGAAAVPDDLEGADAVAVTREPSGGARAPSGKPVVSVGL